MIIQIWNFVQDVENCSKKIITMDLQELIIDVMIVKALVLI
jgi:hypothetical protein